MATKNPWLGLASYEEPKNDGTDYEFCGRDEETLEMVRLIDNNLFVTLYGSSGIGKTSLLRAGVIPILRRKDYFPLYVRLSQEPKEISYAEAIIKKMTNSGLVIEKSANVKHPDSNDRLFLWEYFATTRFLSEGREVYPVIILDQFEEVFREGDKAKAEVLLKQIYLLLNDELEMPAEAGWSSDTNYRFVASIREDFLFILEDSIDENSLDLYKNNRYRLRPMKPEQARHVVLMPGKDCVEETEKSAVIERIISLSKRQHGNDIDTLMLSLVCAGTYEKKSGEKITLSDLAIWKNNPMEVYYKDAVKGLTANQIRYIQQHLIRDDGSRRRVDASEVKTVFGETTYLQLTKGENRLFAIGDKGQIELLHDQLGMAVYEERIIFEERERKKRQRRIITLISFIVLTIAVFFIFQNNKLKKKSAELEKANIEILQERDRANFEKDKAEKANASLSLAKNNLQKTNQLLEATNDGLEKANEYLKEANYKILQERNGMLAAQSRAVAEKAKDLIDEGNIALACRLLLEVLPDTVRKNNRPYVIEAEHVLRNIFDKINSDNYFSFTPIKGLWNKNVVSAAFSPNGSNLVTTSRDGLMYIWDVESGRVIKQIEANVYLVSYDKDQNVFTAVGDNECYTFNSKSFILENTYKFSNKIKLGTFSNEGKYLAFTTEDSVCIFDTEKYKSIFKIENTDIARIAISPNNRILALAKSVYVDSVFSYSIELWNTLKRERLQSVKVKNFVRSLAFSPNSNYLFFAYNWAEETDTISTIHALSVQNGEIEDWIKNPSLGTIDEMGFNNDGTIFSTVSINNGTARFWDLSSGELLLSVDDSYNHSKPTYSSTGDLVCKSQLWKHVNKSKKKIDMAYGGFAYSEESNSVLVNEKDSIYTCYDCSSWKPLGRWTSNSGCMRLGLSKNYALVQDHKGYILIWDAGNGEFVSSFKAHDETCMYPATISSDEKTVISADNRTGDIIQWELSTGKRNKTIKHFDLKQISFIREIVCHPDGNHIAVSTDRGNLYIIDISTSHTVKIGEHKGLINHISFCQLGCHLISSSTDQSSIIWDLDGHLIRRFTSNNSFSSARISPDHKCLLTVSNGDAQIWDIATQKVKYTVPTMTDAVLTKNGNIITNYEGDLWEYEFPPLVEIINKVRKITNDAPLTEEEKKKYYLK